MRVAICYWGLTRTLSKVYKSHEKHLFNILKKNNIPYDIFLHTWSLKTNYEYVWDEKKYNLSNLNDIKLLNCISHKIDSQDEYLKNLNFSKYFYEKEWTGTPPRTNNQKGEWIPQLLRNHLCALESLKRVYQLVDCNKNEYNYIICIRPDGLLVRDFNINFITELKDNEIIVPTDQRYNGYCDRFAVGFKNYMKYYMKRIDEAPKFRREKHRIDAESYCRYTIDKYAKVKFVDYNYGKLVR